MSAGRAASPQVQQARINSLLPGQQLNKRMTAQRIQLVDHMAGLGLKL